MNVRVLKHPDHDNTDHNNTNCNNHCFVQYKVLIF